MSRCKACQCIMCERDLLRKDARGEFETLCYSCLIEAGVDIKEEEEFDE